MLLLLGVFMLDFLVVELPDLRDWLVERGYPAFQAEQIFSWVFDKGVRDWQQMTNLSAPLREALAKSFRLGTLQPVRDREGNGGVQKFPMADDRQKLRHLGADPWTPGLETQYFDSSGLSGSMHILCFGQALCAQPPASRDD